MNDITALAQREMEQREKFEAWTEESCALPWGYLKKRRTYDGFYSEHTYTSLWAAWKAASMALVEALEKALAGERRWHRVASRVHEQACDSDVKIDELEKNVAELNSARQRITELEKSHAQVIQSRDHYKRMTEEGLKQLAESRTVTLPKRYSCEGYHIDEAYLQEDPEGDCYDRDEVLEALAAAGIQVIEGEG